MMQYGAKIETKRTSRQKTKRKFNSTKNRDRHSEVEDLKEEKKTIKLY